MNTPLVLDHIYDASISKVWKALTDENSMKVWYFPQLVKFEPFEGFEFVFSDDESPYQKKWCVTNVKDERLLSHSWIYKGYPGSSEVTFELFNDESKTCLRVTHTGLDSFPTDAHFARHRFENGWKRILGINLNTFLAKERDK